MIENGILHDAQKIYSKCALETFYVCALVTDDCFSTLFFALNSEEANKKIVNDVSDNYWKTWYPEEWKYSDYCLKDESKTACASNFLNDIHASISDDEMAFSQHKLDTENVMIEALGKVKEHLMGILHNEELYVFASISDDSNSVEFENRSGKILISPKKYQFFINRYKTENDFLLEAQEAWRAKNYSLFIDLISRVKNISALEKKKMDFARSKVYLTK